MSSCTMTPSLPCSPCNARRARDSWRRVVALVFHGRRPHGSDGRSRLGPEPCILQGPNLGARSIGFVRSRWRRAEARIPAPTRGRSRVAPCRRVWRCERTQSPGRRGSQRTRVPPSWGWRLSPSSIPVQLHTAGHERRHVQRPERHVANLATDDHRPVDAAARARRQTLLLPAHEPKRCGRRHVVHIARGVAGQLWSDVQSARGHLRDCPRLPVFFSITVNATDGVSIFRSINIEISRHRDHVTSLPAERDARLALQLRPDGIRRHGAVRLVNRNDLAADRARARIPIPALISGTSTAGRGAFALHHHRHRRQQPSSIKRVGINTIRAPQGAPRLNPSQQPMGRLFARLALRARCLGLRRRDLAHVPYQISGQPSGHVPGDVRGMVG